TIERGVFKVHEPGARSRYLTSSSVLGIRPISWRTTEDLRERTALLAAELGSRPHACVSGDDVGPSQQRDGSRAIHRATHGSGTGYGRTLPMCSQPPGVSKGNN